MSSRSPGPLPRPRTKLAISPHRRPNGDILLARDVYGLGLRLSDPDGRLWRLLGVLDGHRDLDQVARMMRRSGHRLDRPELDRVVAALVEQGIVEVDDPEPLAAFRESERARYRANLDFFSLATLGTPLTSARAQLRLKRARVTILGVGAVGGATAMSLAAAGVGHLRLIDPDVVETSNLNRQVLYRTRDIGRPKVEAAARHLRELNPHVRVRTLRRRVRRPQEIVPLLEDCDVFVLGADQPHEILLWTNDAAERVGRPWLEDSYSGPRVAVALFVPGKTPCLRCQQRHLAERERRRGGAGGEELFARGGANAVVAPTAGVAGHLGALQVLCHLAGVPTAAEGRMVHLNLWRPDDTQVVRPPFWKDCPACGRRRGRRRA